MIRARLTAATATLTLVASVVAANGVPVADRVEELRAHAHKAAAVDAPIPSSRLSNVPCTNGAAGPFSCDGLDLLSFVPLSTFQGRVIRERPGWLVG